MTFKSIISTLLVVALMITGSMCAEKLIFEDEFNDFDLDKWKHEISMFGGGNWEFQMYGNSRQNSFVKDGKLHIQPTLTVDSAGNRGDEKILFSRMDISGTNPADLCTSNQDWGCVRDGNPDNIINPVKSARLRTAESFSFKYGRVEVRAKLPKGDWIWPAIWMLPINNAYGSWPASGEVDIMESHGNVNDMQGMNVKSSLSTLHWGPSFKENGYPLTGTSFELTDGSDLSQDFHTYGLYWDEHGMYTYVDDSSNKVLDVPFNQSFSDRAHNAGFNWEFDPYTDGISATPFDQQFYIIMNVAVGGTNGYFPDNVPNKPWVNDQPGAPRAFWNAREQWYPTWKESSAMVVESVKVWSIDSTEYSYHGKLAERINQQKNQLHSALSVDDSANVAERTATNYSVENAQLSVFNITLISLCGVLMFTVVFVTYLLFKSKRTASSSLLTPSHL